MNDIKNRVVDEFLHIVEIDSLSLKEKKMFDYLKQRLKEFPVEIDFLEYNIADINQSSGNMIVKLPSNAKTKRSLFFDAHVDTVEPGLGIKPVIEGDIIKSLGGAILGADDKAGVAAMIIAIEEIIDSKMEHNDIFFIFTSAEEVGLMGVTHLDLSRIKADYGFILDSHGSVGGVIVAAPYHYQYDIKVKGRASHAGISPEKGVNAITIAAKIITELPQGRISRDTVANIGIIEGGAATNIIAEECSIRGEYRSLNMDDVTTIYKKVEKTVENYKPQAVDIELKQTELYKGFDYDMDEDIIHIVDRSIKALDLTPRYERTGGGSNTNIYNQNNIKALTLATGMNDIHSTSENISKNDLYLLTRLLLKIVEFS